MKKIVIINILLLVYAFGYSQNTITGTFPYLANQQIKLAGYNGFNTYTIDTAKADEKGSFTLNYSKNNYGMAYLTAEDNKQFLLVLEESDIVLQGLNFEFIDSLHIVTGVENKLFEQYIYAHTSRENALAGWYYLEKIYKLDTLFSNQETTKQIIASEKQRIKTEDNLFLVGLPKNSYISYYLPLRKLVCSVSTIAQYRTEEIPATMEAFRKIDYTAPRLQKSGLLRDVIESHVWFIENSGRALDSVYIEMNKSIDILVANLLPHEQKLNEITEYLFKFLEKRSLFKASEYLALKLLNEQGCTLNNDFAAQLESYRAMKKGNIAPDFEFQEEILAPNYEIDKQPKKLSD